MFNIGVEVSYAKSTIKSFPKGKASGLGVGWIVILLEALEYLFNTYL